MNIWMIIGTGLIFYFVWRKSTIRWEIAVAHIGLALAAVYGLIAIIELIFAGAVVAP